MAELPDVAGMMDCSLAMHERRLRRQLAEEQRKASPDNALIAVLCDAVRCVREYVQYATGRPLIELPPDSSESREGTGQ